jgi:hypothetical protein
MERLFLLGLLVHLIADWLLQTDWMALNKTKLSHPASWVHSGIHTAGFLIIYPVPVALVLGFSHLIIDTRVPLIWWRKLLRQVPEGATGFSFAMWQDQAVHIIFIIIAVLVIQRWGVLDGNVHPFD